MRSYLDYNDVDWAISVLSRITYKPGWTLKVEPDLFTEVEGILTIEFVTEDTYHPGRMSRIMMRETIPYYILTPRDEKKFTRYILDTLIKAEKHEAREWFKVDGVIFDNPHK